MNKSEDGKGFETSGKISMRRTRRLKCSPWLRTTLSFNMITTFLRSLVHYCCCELKPAQNYGGR